MRGKTRGSSSGQDRKGKKFRNGGQAVVPRHREGEEAGKIKSLFIV